MAELSSLDTLEQGELEVLWRRLKGQKEQVICKQMGMSAATVYRYQASAYYKLGIDQELGRKLKWIQFEREWRETIAPMTEEEVKNWKPKVKVEVPQEPENINFVTPRNRWVWVGLGILVVILLFGFVFQRKTVVPTPTSTIRPSETNQPILTPSASSSETLAVVPVIPPSETSTITPTITPTVTLTETVVSENVLFQDNFDGELSKEWKISLGNPYTYAGVLNIEDEVYMSVGDNWTDYQITFSVENPHCSGFGWPWIGVRATDSGNMIRLYFCEIGGYWSEVINNNPVTLEATKVSFNQNAFDVKITVKGNSYQFNDYLPYTNDRHPEGKIFLYFWPGAKVDNFKVIKL